MKMARFAGHILPDEWRPKLKKPQRRQQVWLGPLFTRNAFGVVGHDMDLKEGELKRPTSEKSSCYRTNHCPSFASPSPSLVAK